MRSSLIASCLLVAAAVPAASQNNSYGNPEKRPPRATSASISEADLMSRLYVFADDSMEGRNAPLASNARGNAYLVRELQRLKIAPAGLLGSYYQVLPYVERRLSPRTSLTINGEPLRLGTDFTVSSRGAVKIIDSSQVIFAGVSGNADQMILPEWAANRFVIVLPAPPDTTTAARGGGAGGGRGGAFGGTVNVATRYAGAIAI